VARPRKAVVPSGVRGTQSSRAGRRPPRFEWPGVGMWALAAWGALLVLAPAEHNGFWGVNGFRSLPPGGRVVLCIGAAASTGLLFVRSRLLAGALAGALALALAFPLRESVHFLGDTQVRLRAMAIFDADLISVTLAEWSTRLHANPLDILVSFLAPIGLRRLGLPLLPSVSVLSVVLALAFVLGLWRVAGRLGLADGSRVAACAAMAVAGTLEAFAGYAESTGLLLASAAWWWAEMLAPLDSHRQATRTAGAWLVLAASHRLGLVMLLPLAWRAMGPAHAGDRPEARRRLLLLSAGAAALAAAGMAATGGGRQLGTDVRDLTAALASVLRAVPPSDFLNALALTAPLAFLAPWLVGRAAVAGFVRRPHAGPLVAGSLALLPLVWLIPANASGLGAHRDWDLAALGGVTLTITATALLAGLSPGRLRGALACVLPLLTLQAGGWVMVNASEIATMRRARALVEGPPGLVAPHLSHLHVYLGQRAMDLGEPAYAAPEFEHAFALNRNPRRAFLAVEAWALAGDLPRARAALAAGRAAGPLSPSLAASERRLEELIARLAADSVRRALPAAPAPR